MEQDILPREIIGSSSRTLAPSGEGIAQLQSFIPLLGAQSRGPIAFVVTHRQIRICSCHKLNDIVSIGWSFRDPFIFQKLRRRAKLLAIRAKGAGWWVGTILWKQHLLFTLGLPYLSRDEGIILVLI